MSQRYYIFDAQKKKINQKTEASQRFSKVFILSVLFHVSLIFVVHQEPVSSKIRQLCRQLLSELQSVNSLNKPGE